MLRLDAESDESSNGFSGSFQKSKDSGNCPKSRDAEVCIRAQGDPSRGSRGLCLGKYNNKRVIQVLEVQILRLSLSVQTVCGFVRSMQQTPSG
jgi:hypothetical protein